MNKILITLLLIIVGCSNNPVNSQGVDVTETDIPLYWMGNSSEPFTMTVNQSTLQMMWFFSNVTINGEPIDTDDWVECEDSVDDIIGIVHSHPDNELQFSLSDKISCKNLDLSSN